MIMDLLASIIILTKINRVELPKVQTLSEHTISLEKRYGNAFVNNVFKDNILLSLAYTRGIVKAKEKVDWDKVRQPFSFEFKLSPNEVFAFHDSILAAYKNSVVRTTRSHFDSSQDFKSDGYLTGDGVCHLASLIYWVAKDANLTAEAPTNHNFAPIPEIDKKYGVAIYYFVGQESSSSLQNLYVTNNQNTNIIFRFDYDGQNLSLKILKEV